MDFLTSHKFAGNELWRYLAVFIGLLVTFIITKVIGFFINKRYETLKQDESKKLLSLIFNAIPTPLTVILFSIGFFLTSLILKVPSDVRILIHSVFNIATAIGIALLIYKLVDLLEFYLGKITAKTESKLDDMLVPLFRKTLRVLIVMILGLYIMESISGKPITTLLAGLGLGGLAIALAAQDTIKNLFGTFMILSDQPFKVGDRICVDDIDGPVEEVGFRSTKVRTLTGHLVTIPNDKLINANITNIGKRPYIRRLANITITYDTPIEKVNKAVDMIREILDKNSDPFPADFPPRVYFNDFNDCSLNILVLYWFAPPAYWDFLEYNQKINLEIMTAFEKEGIEFAFPTQTIYLANDDKRQLSLKMLNKE